MGDLSCLSEHSGNVKSSKSITPANSRRLQNKHRDAYGIPAEAKRKGEVRVAWGTGTIFHF